jgi:hypothetical protein
VQAKPQQQQKIVNEIVSSKLFAPEEKRISHAQAINSYGQQKKMSVTKPSHVGKVIVRGGRRKRQLSAPTSGDVINFLAGTARRGVSPQENGF